MKQVSAEIRKEIINASLIASIRNSPGLHRDYLFHCQRDIIINMHSNQR